MKHRFWIFISSLFVVSLPATGQVLFEELSGTMGITHMHRSFKYLGGGVAVFDFDNDGWQDVYLTGGQNSDKLLHNLGNGQFEDVTIQSGIGAFSQTFTFGVTTGDIDNDGYRDILVTTEFGSQSIMLRNQGNGTFTALPNAINDGTTWKTAASFGDVNNDGLLDVYITSYVFQSGFIQDGVGTVIGFAHDCSPNMLFLNNGNLTFTDVSGTYGVNNEGCALATAFTDFDNDRDMDLMLANDFGAWVQPSALFENELPIAQLADISVQSDMDLSIYGMGIAIGDYDKDGDLDYYQTNLGRNVLSRNDNGWFADVTTEANCENDSTGQLLNTSWGSFFFDADNDSWPDLFVSNGEINSADIIANVLRDPNKLFLNNGDGTFTDISDVAEVSSTLRGRGAAYGDFDNDGRLDLFVNNIHKDNDSTHFEYYHNISEVGNWIAFKLHGTQSNRDAFGSHIRLVQNGVSVLAEVDGGSSHASQNSSVVHFGLGENTVVDSVIVSFPSGIDRIFTNVEANQIHQVYEDITIGVHSNADEFDELIVVNTGSNPIIRSSRSNEVSIALFDISGRMVHSASIHLDNGDNLMQLPDLSSGVYLLRLTTRSIHTTNRIFIK
ncbi:MAG: FG-GAP-like repeat-containing protein [Flavobacteriales bacterium]|nr:FG-GAP-like repeat-containing protein [Flavobacteriales bacterium]